MADKHVCPVWVGHLLASPLRKLVHNPEKILKPHVEKGMKILDIGCAMGFFSLPLARLSGSEGKLICIDLQKEMLDSLEKRAKRAGLAGTIETRLCRSDSLCIDDLKESIDLAVAFAVVHEVPDTSAFFREIHSSLKPSTSLFIAEPASHVSIDDFELTIETAVQMGFSVTENPGIRRRRTALLKK